METQVERMREILRGAGTSGLSGADRHSLLHGHDEWLQKRVADEVERQREGLRQVLADVKAGRRDERHSGVDAIIRVLGPTERPPGDRWFTSERFCQQLGTCVLETGSEPVAVPPAEIDTISQGIKPPWARFSRADVPSATLEVAAAAGVSGRFSYSSETGLFGSSYASASLGGMIPIPPHGFAIMKVRVHLGVERVNYDGMGGSYYAPAEPSSEDFRQMLRGDCSNPFRGFVSTDLRAGFAVHGPQASAATSATLASTRLAWVHCEKEYERSEDATQGGTITLAGEFGLAPESSDTSLSLCVFAIASAAAEESDDEVGRGFALSEYRGPSDRVDGITLAGRLRVLQIEAWICSPVPLYDDPRLVSRAVSSPQ